MCALQVVVSNIPQLRAVRKIRRQWKHTAKKLDGGHEWPTSASKWPEILDMAQIMQDLVDADEGDNLQVTRPFACKSIAL